VGRLAAEDSAHSIAVLTCPLHCLIELNLHSSGGISPGREGRLLQGCSAAARPGGTPQAVRHCERLEKPWRAGRLTVKGQRIRAVDADPGQVGTTPPYLCPAVPLRMRGTTGTAGDTGMQPNMALSSESLFASSHCSALNSSPSMRLIRNRRSAEHSAVEWDDDVQRRAASRRAGDLQGGCRAILSFTSCACPQ
jgi:hypothetical protein